MNLDRFPSALVFVIAVTSTILLPFRCSARENSYAGIPELKADVEGCAELKEVPKVPESVLVSCDKGDPMEVTMPLKPDAQGYARDKTVRGAYQFREYKISPSDQQEQVFSNLMQLLPIAGFSIKFSSSPSTITGHKEGAWILVNVSGEYYDVKVVRVNEEVWTPVKDAQEISREMEAHKRVAIYGIQFSPDNQAVLGENSKILAEVLTYLKGNPGLTIDVESHKMSNNGNAQDDQEITRKRAKAVVEWLEAHGIAVVRLQPKALGRNKPITENDTPLEIQRNERIELAKTAP
jgi:outer membrane protein OmpA-like peptidoglycan-associated protein